MVDRVYKKDLPRLEQRLLELRKGFQSFDSSRTDWVKLRIDPLIGHARRLQRLMGSEEFSTEASRLTRGVALFHSDLVYLRENVKSLEKLLESERKKPTEGHKFEKMVG